MSKLTKLLDKLPETPDPAKVALGLCVLLTVLGQGVLTFEEHDLVELDADVKKGIKSVTRTFALALVLTKLTKESKK